MEKYSVKFLKNLSKSNRLLEMEQNAFFFFFQNLEQDSIFEPQ